MEIDKQIQELSAIITSSYFDTERATVRVAALKVLAIHRLAATLEKQNEQKALITALAMEE